MAMLTPTVEQLRELVLGFAIDYYDGVSLRGWCPVCRNILAAPANLDWHKPDCLIAAFLTYRVK